MFSSKFYENRMNVSNDKMCYISFGISTVKTIFKNFIEVFLNFFTDSDIAKA